MWLEAVEIRRIRRHPASLSRYRRCRSCTLVSGHHIHSSRHGLASRIFTLAEDLSTEWRMLQTLRGGREIPQQKAMTEPQYSNVATSHEPASDGILNMLVSRSHDCENCRECFPCYLSLNYQEDGLGNIVGTGMLMSNRNALGNVQLFHPLHYRRVLKRLVDRIETTCSYLR